MMETLWFFILSLMLAIYVVLDGFDFGVGIVLPVVAKTETERRTVLASIGPVWNGNEVWLIASGAILFFAFPKAYAAGFSGFYLALILVLWLLICRGLALELRPHLDHVLWRQGWDVVFTTASLMLAIVFGAALGNLIRGVPLNSEGYFFVPLWTDFRTGPDPGILDWFTVLIGATSTASLAFHGANYLAMKTDGDLSRQAAMTASRLGWVTVGTILLTVTAVPFVQPALQLNFAGHPIEYLVPLSGLIALVSSLILRRCHRDTAAFGASSCFILLMLGSVACGMYPHILISSADPSLSLTAFDAATNSYGLQVGFRWFGVGFPLLLVYQIYVHRIFWGKVQFKGH